VICCFQKIQHVRELQGLGAYGEGTLNWNRRTNHDLGVSRRPEDFLVARVASGSLQYVMSVKSENLSGNDM